MHDRIESIETGQYFKCTARSKIIIELTREQDKQ